MPNSTRDAELGAVFVRLADNFVSGADIIDLLTTLVEESKHLLNIDEVGLLLLDAAGDLQVAATTSEETRLVEILHLSGKAGPGLHAFQTRTVFSVDDVQSHATLWATFAEAALEHGFRGVHAVPLRLRDDTIGVMNLFSRKAQSLNAPDAAVGQSFADIATISIIGQRNLTLEQVVRGHIQEALNTRVVIEQAKGIISEARGLSMKDSFDYLRRYSRDNNIKLNDVARKVVDRAIRL